MLNSGTRLGLYEIVAPLGAGGMGEVYRAHDTKLGRDVALKVLPDSFTHDPERLARFRREAQVSLPEIPSAVKEPPMTCFKVANMQLQNPKARYAISVND
jgi:serine/threonine protein kinase